MWSRLDGVLSLCKSGAKSGRNVTHYDFVLASGKTWSVDVSSCNKGTGKVFMHANFWFFHLAEVDLLISDITKT